MKRHKRLTRGDAPASLPYPADFSRSLDSGRRYIVSDGREWRGTAILVGTTKVKGVNQYCDDHDDDGHP